MRSRVLIALSAAILASTALSGCGTSSSNPSSESRTGVSSSPYTKGNYPGILKIGNPYDIAGRTYFPSYQPDYVEEGVASWYGPGFHGRATANGERFDQDALTAAHRTLPLPSMVRVTNLENGRTATLKVNDRGPFAKDRIIDLSKRAAMDLGVIANGTARVRVEYLGEETRDLIASLMRNNQIKADDATLTMLAMNDLKHDGAVTSDAPSGMGVISSANAAEPVYGATQRGVVERAPMAPVVSRNLQEPQGRVMQGTAREEIRVARIERPAAEAMPAIPYREGGVIPRTMPSNPLPLEVPPVNVIPDVAPPPPSTPRHAPDSPAPRRPVMPPDIAPESPLQPAPLPDDAAPMPPKRPNDLQPLPEEVRATPPQSPRAAPVSGTFIQAGAFGQEQNAHDLSRRLASLGRTMVKPVDVNGRTWYRVRLGPLSNHGDVQAALQRVKGMGLPDAHVVRD